MNHYAGLNYLSNRARCSAARAIKGLKLAKRMDGRGNYQPRSSSSWRTAPRRAFK